MTGRSFRRPTIVIVVFDKKNTKVRLQQDASGVLRYIARLQGLPDGHSPPDLMLDYVARDPAVLAFAASGFESTSLRNMARELAVDTMAAGKKVYPTLVHGAISIKVAPDQVKHSAKDLLAVGHRLMKLFGVEENRYVLAVHGDTDHLHLHFLYSRVGIHGALRERERKLPKFMAEEACAVLAHEFGFDLESRHLSRVVDAGVLDLASGKLTRDAAFDAIPSGGKARNAARATMKDDDLRKLALVALHLSGGDLGRFRSELAEHGISYLPAGTGSHLEDVNGKSFAASAVDDRFRLGKIKLVGVASGLPPEPSEIWKRVAQRRRDLVALEVPKSDPTVEWERYARNRRATDRPLEGFRSQAHWCDEDVKRAFREDKRGRPTKRDRSVTWPANTHAAGALGCTTFHLSTITLDPGKYKKVEQKWRSEFWDGDALVATVRYDRLVIYSNKAEDQRAALMAAQEAWGKVEVFGDRKFKIKMVKLAAELGVELSNPELKAPLADARVRHKADMLANLLVAVPVPEEKLSPVEITPPASAQVAEVTNPQVGEDTPLGSTGTTKTVSGSVLGQTTTVPALRQVDETRASLVKTKHGEGWLVLLVPSEAKHFGMSEEAQRLPVVQRQLQAFYDRQEQEHALIIDSVVSGQSKAEEVRHPYDGAATYKFATDDDDLAALWRLHQRNSRLQHRLALAHEAKVAAHAAKAVLPANTQVGISSLDKAEHEEGQASEADRGAAVRQPFGDAANPDVATGSLPAPAVRKESVGLSPEAVTPGFDSTDKIGREDTQSGSVPSVVPDEGSRSLPPAPDPPVLPSKPMGAGSISSLSMENALASDAAMPGAEPAMAPRIDLLDPQAERLVASYDVALKAKDLAARRQAAVAIRAKPAARAHMDANGSEAWRDDNQYIERQQALARSASQISR